MEQCSRIGSDLRSQPFTLAAPAERAVEREAVRGERLETATTAVAGEVLAVRFDWPAQFRHAIDRKYNAKHTLAQRKAGFHAASDSAAAVGVAMDAHAIDDDFHVVLAAAVDFRRLIDATRRAVDAHSLIALRAHFVPQRFVFLA